MNYVINSSHYCVLTKHDKPFSPDNEVILQDSLFRQSKFIIDYVIEHTKSNGLRKDFIVLVLKR